jgi:hypothetical protein
METNTIVDEEVFQSHKHQKLVEALRANSINQEDPVPEWLYKGCVDVSGARIGGKDAIRCLCSTPISKFYKIQNKYTEKDEIIGCECIKKFLENSVTCEKCKKPLKNLGVRLNTNNMVCPDCVRGAKAERKELMKKYGNYKYYAYGDHLRLINGFKFKNIIHDNNISLVEFIVNKPPPPVPWKSYDCLMEYINYHYEIT